MYKRVLVLAFTLLCLPFTALAHEVYVLPANNIVADISAPSFDMSAVAFSHMHQFLFWGLVTIITIAFVFGISIVRPLERAVAPLLSQLKPYAFAAARLTVGLGLICSGFFSAAFGPELPLTQTFGAYASTVAIIIMVLGACIAIGLWARAAALVAAAFFAVLIAKNDWYMLTYANYLGEFLVLVIIGSHRASVHALTGWHERFHRRFHQVADRIKQLAFPLLRISFGVSLIYASAYAKVLHNNLALQVASLPLAGHAYPLAHYFGLEPHFLVLGAAIIEITLGLFFILGVEIRFASCFLLFWLSLSLWYFGESVWPHVILIGIPIALIMHGYDRYSLEGALFKKGRLEPVL